MSELMMSRDGLRPLYELAHTIYDAVFGQAIQRRRGRRKLVLRTKQPVESFVMSSFLRMAKLLSNLKFND
ncbi:hypothetical protein LguiA_003725 [Lonicera macranthoides]